MIDTHCHVDQFPSPEKIVRDCEAQRLHVIAVTNLPSHFKIGADRLRANRFVTPALGLHPLCVTEGVRELPAFKRLAQHVDYIGEIGLDFSRHGKESRTLQERVFEEVLQAVKDRPRFITLHSRGAEKAVLDGLRRNGITGAVFHWFTGSERNLTAVIDGGHYLSINPAMLSSASGRRVIKAAPKEMLLVESDGPFAKVGGRAASPHDVSLVYAALAKEWQMSLEAAIETVSSNFAKITVRFHQVE